MTRYQGKPAAHNNTQAKNITAGLYEMPDLYRESCSFAESKATHADVISTIGVTTEKCTNLEASKLRTNSPIVNGIANHIFIALPLGVGCVIA
jgi:hypothetical protein